VLPSISIVIPTYSRPKQLAVCLQSLLLLDYPRDRLEVIVVDDGGEPPLDAVVAPFRSALTLSLLRQPNAGPAAARNTGAERAGGEFIAFTDDDCLPEPGWLQEMAHALSTERECMVGGTTVNAAPNLYATTSQLIVDVVYQSAASATNLTEARLKTAVRLHSTQATNAAATMKMPYPSGPSVLARYAAVSSPVGLSRLSARNTRIPPATMRRAGVAVTARGSAGIAET
jgi:glycosyltransferase involved in cell wall biosynthesis